MLRRVPGSDDVSPFMLTGRETVAVLQATVAVGQLADHFTEAAENAHGSFRPPLRSTWPSCRIAEAHAIGWRSAAGVRREETAVEALRRGPSKTCNRIDAHPSRRPMWSSYMCVTSTRVTLPPPSGPEPANSLRHTATVSNV